MSGRLPIADYIASRMQALGLSRGQLARRCGNKNVTKTLRRIDSILQGATRDAATRPMLTILQTALEADEAEFLAAVAATEAVLDAADRAAEEDEERRWRRSFAPHGYLLGSSTRPSSITMYGVSGGSERWLKIRLDLSLSPATFPRQALGRSDDLTI